MSKSSSTIRVHLGLAALFLFCVVSIWVLPVFLAGYTYEIFTHHIARAYSEVGLFSFADGIGRVLSSALLPSVGVSSAVDGRLSIVYTAWLSQWISWSDTVTWALACAATFAVGLWFYWYAVAKVFSVRIAWIALVVAAFMPVYFRQATWFDSYPLGFVFLFAAMAAFVRLRDKNLWLGIIASGLLIGASASAKDVFLLFIPWLLITFYWHKQLVKGAVFLACILLVYLLPYIGDIRTHGYPINQNIARLWPGADELANESYLHLYPDPYTYYFDKERFDEQFVAAQSDKPLYESMADEKVILSYDLSSNFFRRVRLSSWLLLHDLLPFTQRQAIGGAFILLFMIPGCFALLRTHRKYALWFLGLILLMFFEIRFLLLYEREHFINIAWVVALFVAIGISEVGQAVAVRFKLRTDLTIVTLVCLVALQLLQSSRYEFANLYTRSTALETMDQAAALELLPPEAVVSLGSNDTTESRIRTLTDRTLILFREETLSALLTDGKLADAFTTYGVTHLLGYNAELTNRIRAQLPAIQVVTVESIDREEATESSLLRVLVQLLR